MRPIEDICAVVVDSAFKLHRDLGPGMLKSVYEVVLASILQKQGLHVQRQLPVPITYAGLRFDEGFRVDLMVENRLVLELKSVEAVQPVHAKQLLTYLRLLDQPLGLLINFGSATFKAGIKRIVNNHQEFAASRLRVSQTDRESRSFNDPQSDSPETCDR